MTEGASAEGGPARGEALSIITGMSGAGRSTAAKCLEDLGWFVIDNLPPSLISKVVELGASAGSPNQRMALVTDVRGGTYFGDLEKALDELSATGVDHTLLFLDASNEALVRRFEEVRRPHPLAPGGRVVDGIAEERALLEGLRARADLIVDTSDLNVHELREKIRDAFGDGDAAHGMQVSVISFGYKYGIPIDADLVFDCRFLPNPHWRGNLRPLLGTDPRVRDYVMEQSAAGTYLAWLEGFFDFLLPAVTEEGRAYLSIAIGCTGGRHRSVVLAEQIGALMTERGVAAKVRHRDMLKGPPPPAELPAAELPAAEPRAAEPDSGEGA